MNITWVNKTKIELNQAKCGTQIINMYEKETESYLDNVKYNRLKILERIMNVR